MKHAINFLMMLLVVCALSADCVVGDCAQTENTENIVPFDEVKCKAAAKKWVKETDGLVEGFLEAKGGLWLKINSLNNLAILQAKTGDKDAAIKTFERVKKFAKTNADIFASDSGYVMALCRIAVDQAEVGLYDLAEKTARSSYDKNNILTSVMKVAVNAGDFDVAKRLFPKGHEFIAIAEAEAGRFEDAKKTAGLLLEHGGPTAGRAFARIALLEAKAGKVDEAKKTLAEAKKNLPADVTKRSGSYFYQQIAMAEAELGMIDLAMTTMDNIQLDDWKFPVLMLIADLKAKSGDKKLVAKLIDQAKSIALKSDFDSQKIYRLLHVAVMEAKAIGKAAAMKTFEDARTIAEKHNKKYHLLYYVQRIVESKAKAGFYAEAKEDAKKCGDGYCLILILMAEAEAGLYEQAKETAAMIKDRFCNQGFYEIALIQARAGKFEQAHKTMQSARNIHISLLVQITNLELDAGETRYVIESVARLEKYAVLGNQHYLLSPIAEFLARAGYDKRVKQTYKLIKNLPANKRFHFCLGAAEGFLKRLEDNKARADK